MRKKVVNRKLLLAALALTATTIFTGCGNTGKEESNTSGSAGNTASESAEGTSESGESDGVTIIRVGTGNSYNPACYLDENGELAGYDYAVLQAIDELLPQYEFTYETFDFQNVLLALESNKIDLAAHQYEWNEDRGENYLYGEEGYTVFDNYVYVTDDTDLTDIHSLEDFAGKTIQAIAGDNKAYYYQKYNEEHPDKQLILDFTTPSTTEEQISYYTSGKWAFLCCPKKDIELYNEAWEGVHFKQALDEPLNSSLTYFLFRKNDEASTELQKAVDGALRELKESGRLSEISIEYWGADYTGADVE